MNNTDALLKRASEILADNPNAKFILINEHDRIRRATGREFPEENLRDEQDNILDLCRNYSVQNCHLCDAIHCGDNLKWTGRATR